MKTALTLVLFSFSIAANASVIYTYSDTQWTYSTPSYLSPLVLTTVGFSLTTPDYLTGDNWFYQFDSCQGVYGMACQAAELDQNTPGTVSVGLYLDGGTEYSASFPASLLQDGTYTGTLGDTLTVQDPPATAPEPATWGLLLCAALMVALGRPIERHLAASAAIRRR